MTLYGDGAARRAPEQLHLVDLWLIKAQRGAVIPRKSHSTLDTGQALEADGSQLLCCSQIGWGKRSALSGIGGQRRKGGSPNKLCPRGTRKSALDHKSQCSVGFLQPGGSAGTAHGIHCLWGQVDLSSPAAPNLESHQPSDLVWDSFGAQEGLGSQGCQGMQLDALCCLCIQQGVDMCVPFLSSELAQNSNIPVLVWSWGYLGEGLCPLHLYPHRSSRSEVD